MYVLSTSSACVSSPGRNSISATMAFELARHGHHISEALSSLGNVTVLPLDVADTASVAAAAQTVAEAGRGLDVLVNNAGIECVQPVLDVNITTAQRIFDINLWGPLRTIWAFADLLIASRGCIVNVSSSASVTNSPWVWVGKATYAASKAGLNIVSETLRLELAPFGLGVIAILPGAIDSKLHLNNGTNFDIPPTSRYVAIKDISKDSLSAEKFVQLVLDDVIGTKKGGG
ncbi:oxidoreductase [Hypoxylon rubiginosum]|uniref:Oxidoreductase n=1 Tax=Hypoxylon rubiginosum TaxID=110542 RepID=A0ACB9Z9L7_9PEZI|nr:oxidoreductase [Hypoxylon rubiginosum]